MTTSAQRWILPAARFDALLDELRGRGYSPIGPRLRDGAFVYDELRSHAQLPVGWGDAQEPGRYRVERRDDDAWFGYASSAQSFKRNFLRPREPLLQIRRNQRRIEPTVIEPDAQPLALVGARSCDLHGLARLDQVMLAGPHPDAHYAARRESTFVVAVQCTAPASTCFCTSMGTGPQVSLGYDVALTELVAANGDESGHRFIAFAGSEQGAEVIESLKLDPATIEDERRADERLDETRRRIERRVDTEQLPQRLLANPEHPGWQEVAERCLACANCTMACPTCFCHSVTDSSDLGGEIATRTRDWDSCFTEQFSFVHGGSVRTSVKARYRQWLTHKFATWHEQFGSSGCVGCGRCISWCPVGIDVTEEIAKLTSGTEVSS